MPSNSNRFFYLCQHQMELVLVGWRDLDLPVGTCLADIRVRTVFEYTPRTSAVSWIECQAQPRPESVVICQHPLKNSLVPEQDGYQAIGRRPY